VWTEGYYEKIYYRRHICEPTGVSEENGKRGVSVISCEVGGEFLVYMPQEGEVNVEIYDIMGRKVGKKKFYSSRGVSIDLSGEGSTLGYIFSSLK
jgi:hypothetical protein